MNVHEITLDVSKEPAHEPSLYIAQGDKNGTTLKVNVYDNGQALTLTSYTVSFCMRSPDAQDYYEVAGTASGNVATFLIDETYAAGHPGITEIAYINIINGTSNITSSSRLRVVVLPSAKEGVVPAPAYVSEIDQFIDDAQGQIDAAVDQAEDAAADALEAAEEAREAAGGTVPLMSPTQRGGAKLGHGLSIDNDALNLGPLTDSGSGASVQTDGCGIFGVTGEGFAHQDGTPTPDNPQEIRVARGRNLVFKTIRGCNLYATGDIVTDNSFSMHVAMVTRGAEYVITTKDSGNFVLIGFFTSEPDTGSVTYDNSRVILNSGTFIAPITGYVAFRSTIDFATPQLEQGSQATPYVPYGHIGLDVTVNGQTTTTPIPLPAKGFAGALPDGTKDTLAIDSAGRVEWVNACGIVTPGDFSFKSANASEGRSLFVTQGVSSHGWGTSDVPPILATHMVAVAYSAYWVPGTASIYITTGVIAVSVDLAINTQALLASTYPTLEVLYPLAGQTTESTYIQLPELPEGATVSIPELEAIGVEWWVEGGEAMAEHGRDVSRANKEQEDRIAELEAAVANLATS